MVPWRIAAIAILARWSLFLRAPFGFHWGDIPMLAYAGRLILFITTFALFAINANAQSVHPKCAKMKDKVRCTCFFSNGGLVERSPSGRWRVVMYTPGQLDGYFQCMKRHGRPLETPKP
jgi:hypothetical protein